MLPLNAIPQFLECIYMVEDAFQGKNIVDTSNYQMVLLDTAAHPSLY